MLGSKRWFLVAILAATSGFGWAQTVADGEALLASGNREGAAAAFEAAMKAGPAAERPKAGSLMILAWNDARRHDMVEAKFAAAQTAAAGTPYDAETRLYRARSLWRNAADTTTALSVLREITAPAGGTASGKSDAVIKPSEPAFAVSGALYEIGSIEAGPLAIPNAAREDLEALVAAYPTSPFADDALVAIARTGVASAKLDVIDSAKARLVAMGAAPAMVQSAQFERAEFMNKARGDRRAAITEYSRVFTDFPSANDAAALAKIRAADLVPGGDFRTSLAMYRDVLATHPKLTRSLRDWVQCQIGICQFQVRDESAAAETFSKLAATKPGRKTQAVCDKYLTGLSDPESTASLLIAYDRGIRNKQLNQFLDATIRDMQAVRTKAREPWFERFVTDPAVDREERAQMLYRVCFAHFFVGRCEEAYALAQRILDEIGPVKVTKQECLFMQAFLHGRKGDWPESARRWQAILESDPQVDFVPEMYLEYSQALDSSGDSLGAILALDEMRFRFPAVKLADEAGKRIGEITARNPGIVAPAESARPRLEAKWKKRWPPSDDSALGEIAKRVAPATILQVGGAE